MLPGPKLESHAWLKKLSPLPENLDSWDRKFSRNLGTLISYGALFSGFQGQVGEKGIRHSDWEKQATAMALRRTPHFEGAGQDGRGSSAAEQSTATMGRKDQRKKSQRRSAQLKKMVPWNLQERLSTDPCGKNPGKKSKPTETKLRWQGG